MRTDGALRPKPKSVADVPVTEMLASYLARAGRLQFGWGGEIDCWLFGFDWVYERTGIDALEEFRGRYASAREQRFFIKAHGGTRAFAERLLLPLGYARTENPLAGDVALAWAPWKKFHGRILLVHASAICVRPKMWASKPSTGGIVLADFPIFQAWSLDD